MPDPTPMRPSPRLTPETFLRAWDDAHGAAVVPVADIAPAIAELFRRPGGDDGPGEAREGADLANAIRAAFNGATYDHASGRVFQVIGGPAWRCSPDAFALAPLPLPRSPVPADPAMVPWHDRMEAEADRILAADPQAATDDRAAAWGEARQAAFRATVAAFATETSLQRSAAEQRLRAAGIEA